MVQTGCCLHKCHNSTAATTAAAKHHAGTASTRAAAIPPHMRCSARCITHTCCPEAHTQLSCPGSCIRNPNAHQLPRPSPQDSAGTFHKTQIGNKDTAARNHHMNASIEEPLIPMTHTAWNRSSATCAAIPAPCTAPSTPGPCAHLLQGN
jgi:hypothetical protein